jgi:hypothetical protein
VLGGIAPSSLIALRASATAASEAFFVQASFWALSEGSRGFVHPCAQAGLGIGAAAGAGGGEPPFGDLLCSIGPRYSGLSGVITVPMTLRSL